MAKFDQAFNKLLKLEGGFSNFSVDPGGATNFGISLRFLKDANLMEDIDGDGIPDLLGDMDNDGDIDFSDIKTLTKEEAGLIYKTAWWDKYKYGEIPDQDVADKIFDMSVNMGAKQAHKLVQRSINQLPTGKAQLVEDGDLGPNSRKLLLLALNLGAGVLLKKLRETQEDFYRILVTKKPQFKIFLNGWVNRARS